MLIKRTSLASDIMAKERTLREFDHSHFLELLISSVKLQFCYSIIVNKAIHSEQNLIGFKRHNAK